jgi:hypothetical protein
MTAFPVVKVLQPRRCRHCVRSAGAEGCVVSRQVGGCVIAFNFALVITRHGKPAGVLVGFAS